MHTYLYLAGVNLFYIYELLAVSEMVNVFLFKMFCFCCWSSVADISNTEAGLQPQQDSPFFTRAKSDAVYVCGLSVGHGYLSMAVFILIYRSDSYRWAAAVVSRSNERSWALSHKTHMSRTSLSIVFGRQRVYTRILREILNKSWRQHPTRHQLYGHLPPITKTIQVRRTRLAGHCCWSKDELISDVLLWPPTYGRAKAGRPARTYIQQLCEDTGCSPEDLPEAMNDRKKWRERVRDIHASGTKWWWWWWM